MRVVCNTVEDFILNLDSEGSERVDRKVVYIDYNKTSIGEERREDCVKWSIYLQCSAIINDEDEQYLLGVGVNCGIDYTDASKELNGSAKADLLKKKIEKFCEKNGLTIRPGMIEV